jgi:valyl-tRNA synthetase
MIRTAEGKKMSKSMGDKAVNPLSIVEKYGNDALRMSMIVGNTPGNDLKLNENDIRGYGKFANKIWNASRFVLDKIDGMDLENLSPLDGEDTLSQKGLEILVREITKEMNEFRFSIVAEKLYHYFWYTFADIIIERSKKKILENKDNGSPKTLLYLQLTTLLKILHPFIPFVTEEIWSILPTKNKNLIMVEKWPND